MRTDCCLKDRKGAGGEFMFFKLRNLVFTERVSQQLGKGSDCWMKRLRATEIKDRHT